MPFENGRKEQVSQLFFHLCLFLWLERGCFPYFSHQWKEAITAFVCVNMFDSTPTQQLVSPKLYRYPLREVCFLPSAAQSQLRAELVCGYNTLGLPIREELSRYGGL